MPQAGHIRSHGCRIAGRCAPCPRNEPMIFGRLEKFSPFSPGQRRAGAPVEQLQRHPQADCPLDHSAEAAEKSGQQPNEQAPETAAMSIAPVLLSAVAAIGTRIPAVPAGHSAVPLRPLETAGKPAGFYPEKRADSTSGRFFPRHIIKGRQKGLFFGDGCHQHHHGPGVFRTA